MVWRACLFLLFVVVPSGVGVVVFLNLNHRRAHTANHFNVGAYMVLISSDRRHAQPGLSALKVVFGCVLCWEGTGIHSFGR